MSTYILCCNKKKEKRKKRKKRKDYTATFLFNMPWISNYLYHEGIHMFIPEGKKGELIPRWTKKDGRPAIVDPNTPLEGSSSDPTICEVRVDTDGKLKLFGVGTLADPSVPVTVDISVSGDADLGEGVRAVVAVGTATLISAEAVGGSLELGPLEDI